MKVIEPPARDVTELAPFVLSRDRGRSVWHVDFVIAGFVFAVGGNVDELEDEGSAGDDAGATREEVATDDVLED